MTGTSAKSFLPGLDLPEPFRRLSGVGTVGGKLLPVNPADFSSTLRAIDPASIKPLSDADYFRGVKAPDAGTLQPLEAAMRGITAPTGSEHEQIERQAQRLVAQVFFAPLLKQMHDSPFRSELFDGGRGGQAFSQLADEQMVDRMARSASAQGLVKSIVRQLEAKKAYAKQGQKRGGAGTDAAAKPGPWDALNGAAPSPAAPKSSPAGKEAGTHVASARRA